ncbi:MAG: ATP-binding cassette domain-containing protein, partial [Lachnospiraceae bacterium]|nr:ATP-binding cassette domain-containing protein [Lachnospiraceae bacterium]
MALIKVENLSLGYESRTIAENLNFEVKAGDYLCIVGENGSGKTTLMRTLLKLKEPFGGTITFG